MAAPRISASDNISDFPTTQNAMADEVDGKAATSHGHATSDVTSGTFADARIAESNVTQHQAALSVTESQVSDLDHYTTTDANTDIDARVDKAFVDALNVDADTLDGSDSTAFATSAQGSLADSAVQPSDNVSDLTNDSGYLTSTTHDVVARHAYDHLHTLSPMMIVETSTGVWSGDAPARTDGDYPILFVGLSATSDPSDGTNGIDTPANINDSDVVVRPSA